MKKALLSELQHGFILNCIGGRSDEVFEKITAYLILLFWKKIEKNGKKEERQ